jgi:hypothetical protein
MAYTTERNGRVAESWDGSNFLHGPRWKENCRKRLGMEALVTPWESVISLVAIDCDGVIVLCLAGILFFSYL